MTIDVAYSENVRLLNSSDLVVYGTLMIASQDGGLCSQLVGTTNPDGSVSQATYSYDHVMVYGGFDWTHGRIDGIQLALGDDSHNQVTGQIHSTALCDGNALLMSNHGTLSWTTGSWDVGGGGFGNYGTFTATSNVTFLNNQTDPAEAAPGSGGFFTNDGTATFSPDGNETITPKFTTDGFVSVASGTVTFNQKVTQTGGVFAFGSNATAAASGNNQDNQTMYVTAG